MNEYTPNTDCSDVVYTIDDNDRITYVNDDWNNFAANNESEHLLRNQVMHRPLWEFIADQETRHVHQVILKRIRHNQVTLDFPFRCDSPEVRRYMTMKISPERDGAITYFCTVKRIEHRAPLLFNEEKKWRDKALLRMCSWCKKVDVGKNIWLEIEEAVDKLQLLERKRLPEFSHTMCDDCLSRFDNSTS